jgi:hypothetical protein
MDKAVAPKVFISYSHDSPQHSDWVLALAQQLRRDGIDASLDQFHQVELLHWPSWCEQQLRPENADFVLAVCTYEYRRRIEDRAPADVGKGVFWEGRLLYNYLYEAKGNSRFVPVYFDDFGDQTIPAVLGGYSRFHLTHLTLTEATGGYAMLYRLLTGQGGIIQQDLGPLRQLTPLSVETRKTDFIELIAEMHSDVKAIKALQVAESEKAAQRHHQLYEQGQNTREWLEEVIAKGRQQTSQDNLLTPRQRYELALSDWGKKQSSSQCL